MSACPTNDLNTPNAQCDLFAATASFAVDANKNPTTPMVMRVVNQQGLNTPGGILSNLSHNSASQQPNSVEAMEQDIFHSAPPREKK